MENLMKEQNMDELNLAAGGALTEAQERRLLEFINATKKWAGEWNSCSCCLRTVLSRLNSSRRITGGSKALKPQEPAAPFSHLFGKRFIRTRVKRFLVQAGSHVEAICRSAYGYNPDSTPYGVRTHAALIKGQVLYRLS